MEQKSSRFTIDNKTAQGDVRQASIGQGQTLVTPLQNILLVCASVNGGELMQPYVVDRIEDANGNTVSENTCLLYPNIRKTKSHFFFREDV